METKTKLVCLELIGGLFGWVWILSSIAVLYLLTMAIFSNSSWPRFFWAFGIGAVAKWLARGFRDNQLRVGFMAERMAKGLSRDEASKEWFERYTRDKLKKDQDSNRNALSTSKRQPTQEEFWRDPKGAEATQLRATLAMTSSPRIVPVSYPKQTQAKDSTGEEDSPSEQ